MSNEVQPLQEVDDRLQVSFADPRQRRLLSVLRDQSRPLTTRDVAVRLAAREADESPAAVDDAAVRRLLADLHHRRVPKLVRLGWVDRRPDGIVTTEEFPFGEGKLPLPPAEADHRWETLAAVLARPRRERVVEALARLDSPVSLDELAAELAGEPDFRGAGTSPAVVLHHVDLPRLDATGLVDYDPETRAVAARRDLAAVADWLDAEAVTDGLR